MRYIFPALIALATAVTVVAVTREAPSGQEGSVALPVAAAEASAMTPWLLAAAKDLGHQHVRAYDGSIFIPVGDDTISFFKEKNAMQMHVELESQYRHTRAQRDPALKELEVKGQAIFEHALSLQARAQAKEQVAARAASAPAGG